MNIPRLSLLTLVMLAPGLLFMSGCRKTRKTQVDSSNVMSEVNIPTAQDSIKMYDESLGEFALVDDVARAQEESVALAVAQNSIDPADFAWVEHDGGEGFKKIYFDFDAYKISKDQEVSLAYDIERAQHMIHENPDKKITIVVNGHACSSAGSAAYNLALSEKRAKIVADKLIAAGIPQDNIKIVGRGFEVPALDANGNPVRGSKKEQWANRRDEIHLIA